MLSKDAALMDSPNIPTFTFFLEVYLSLKYHTNKYESINWGNFFTGEGGGGNDG